MVKITEVRKRARELFGSIKEEIKLDNGMYYYMGSKAGGYLINVNLYPDVSKITNRFVFVQAEKYYLLGSNLEYMKLLCIYPDIIDKYKKNANVLPEIKHLSKKAYREMSLKNARDIIIKSEPNWIGLQV